MEYQRDWYIPANAIKIDDADRSDAVAYLYERQGVPYAVGFAGRAQKPAWQYRFRSDDERAQYVARFFQGRKATQDAAAQRKAERKARGRGLEVGDVLRSSWGYDQTNVDFYEVTALVGARLVEIRKLAATTHATGDMTGKCAPLVGQYIGQPMRKAARDGCVRIESYATARKMEPKAEVAGVKVYGPSHFSSYA